MLLLTLFSFKNFSSPESFFYINKSIIQPHSSLFTYFKKITNHRVKKPALGLSLLLMIREVSLNKITSLKSFYILFYTHFDKKKLLFP